MKVENKKRMNFVSAGYENANRKNQSKKRMVRILGLMTLISYMTVILFTWIYANFNGYVYFSAGEPLLVIKYSEWLLGFIGIFVAVDFLRKELDDVYILKKYISK